jgi:DNA-binding NarL/FixJ family response regulator
VRSSSSYLSHEAHPERRLRRLSTDVAALEDPSVIEPVTRVGILLMQDQVLLASSLAVLLDLEAGLRVVAVGSDPGHVHRIVAAAAEVVLVDSIAVAAQIHALRPAIRLIVLGSGKDHATLLACIRAGASAWIDKDTLPAELVEIIQRARAGEMAYDPADLVQLLLDPSLHAPEPPRRTAGLGERELQVLEMMATGLTSTQIAEQLGISRHTVRTHLKNIVSKMGARSKLDAALIAIREGRIHLE